MKRNTPRPLSIGITWLAGLLLASSLLPAHATDIFTPYKADYQVTRNDLAIGQAYYQVQPLGDGCFAYQGYAVPEGLAALLVSSTVERSEFCTQGNKITPRSYRMWEGTPEGMANLDRSVAGSRDDDIDDRNYRILFSDNAATATTNGLPPRDVPAGAIDNSSMHFAIRHAVQQKLAARDNSPFDVVVFKENKTRSYQFKVGDKETVQTPAGSFKAVRVDRIDHRKQQLTFWLATEHDLLPVRVTRSKSGDSDYTLSLLRLH